MLQKPKLRQIHRRRMTSSSSNDLMGTMSPILRRLQEFAHAPDVIGEPRCDRRLCEATCEHARSYTAVPEHDRGAVVFPLLTETVREPGKAAKAYPQRKVRPG